MIRKNKKILTRCRSNGKLVDYSEKSMFEYLKKRVFK